MNNVLLKKDMGNLLNGIRFNKKFKRQQGNEATRQRGSEKAGKLDGS
jgi:hypothetical protein